MRHLKPFLFLIAFIVLFFRKTFFLGLIPIPFDLLVAWFFPYSSGGWKIQANYLNFKGGYFAADAIREIYPWKELALSLVKNSELPLWNPYAFSGSPLLANMQSAVFYPLNALFFSIPNFSWAWAAYITSAVVLASFFMFLFLRSLKLSEKSAIFGAIAFAASGYMIVWLEWGSVVHQLIWLPLSLFSIKRWWESRKARFLLLLIFSTSATIFAGYPQGAAYNFMVVISWILYLVINTAKPRITRVLPLIISAFLLLGITAIQWLPTAEFFFNSAMRGEVSQKLSREAALPFPQFATVVAPDYFGNRVTENYWAKKSFSGIDYMDADLYLGVVTLLLALITIFERKRFKETGWLITVLLLGVVLGARTPIASLVANLGIPVISTGAAAEALMMSIFALSCLGALGLERVLGDVTKRNINRAILIVMGLLVVLVIVTISLDPEKALIARKALIIPGSAFVFAAFLLKLMLRRKKRAGLAVLLVTILAVELLLHADKILPFSSRKLAFPRHQLIEELRTRSGLHRIAGFWESEIATNFHTAFRLYSAEGYDPLYIRRYGEFVFSAEEGRLSKSVPRSDADITMANETNRNRLIDLVSIKYVPAKVTNPQEAWEEEPLKYDPSRFKLVWQQEQFKIYENLHALPRVKLFSDWQVLSDDREIIETLYNQQFNPHEQVILEQDTGIEITSDGGKANATIISYKATRVEIETESEKPTILLLTDSFYPGWQASVDGFPTEILRANYTFRAITVPTGNHKIVFRYQPKSFSWGARVSAMTALILIVTVVALSLKQKSSSMLS